MQSLKDFVIGKKYQLRNSKFIVTCIGVNLSGFAMMQEDKDSYIFCVCRYGAYEEYVESKKLYVAVWKKYEYIKSISYHDKHAYDEGSKYYRKTGHNLIREWVLEYNDPPTS